MNKVLLTIAILMGVGFSAASKADYNSYYDCKNEWNVCVVVPGWPTTASYIQIIQMHEEQTPLDLGLQIQVGLNGIAFLVLNQVPIEIGSLGEKNETAYELRLSPGLQMTMASRKGPDTMYCNPVDGPGGEVLFQRDFVHTKLFEIQIFRQQIEIIDWNSSWPQPVYPAYKSQLSTEPCP